MTRVCVGQIEVTVRRDYIWVENGRVDPSQIADLQTALRTAQEIYRSQL